VLLPHNPNAFARSPLDRAGHHRRDAAWLAAAMASDHAKIVPFSQFRPFVIEEGDVVSVGWLGGHARASIAPKDAPTIFLGLDSKSAPHFAIDILDPAPLGELGRFDDLRALGPRLSREELAMIGPAKAVFEWHAKHGFCANCGSPTEIVEAGWKRECPACKAEHFPRLDPVCIMLPVHGEKCLLGRQRAWPRGMHSALAGFIEPGEAIEEAVARETLEEAGLRVREVRLHSTQPWPFPHSLMIGAICEVENNNEKVDLEELESARWFTRDEARQLIAGKFPGAFCPPPFAIAHQLLKSWAGE
jgi:NAD+ diphosphatase